VGRASDLVGALERRVAALEALVEAQAGALAAQGCEAVLAPSPLLARLGSGQERALVGALWRAHPAGIDTLTLLERLPPNDHARDRDVALVKTVVARVRRKLGAAAIETLRGEGFRLSATLHRQLRSDGAPR